MTKAATRTKQTGGKKKQNKLAARTPTKHIHPPELLAGRQYAHIRRLITTGTAL
jgi:hypothetical protein